MAAEADECAAVGGGDEDLGGGVVDVPVAGKVGGEGESADGADESRGHGGFAVVVFAVGDHEVGGKADECAEDTAGVDDECASSADGVFAGEQCAADQADVGCGQE